MRGRVRWQSWGKRARGFLTAKLDRTGSGIGKGKGFLASGKKEALPEAVLLHVHTPAGFSVIKGKRDFHKLEVRRVKAPKEAQKMGEKRGNKPSLPALKTGQRANNPKKGQRCAACSEAKEQSLSGVESARGS